jgi:GNAT superfamily N-acetyltransferase
MEFVTAEQRDLNHILSWLRDEENTYNQGKCDRGFWRNRSAITRAFDDGRLEVVRTDGFAIAFHFGEFFVPGITEVHPDFRGQGIGSTIAERIRERAFVNEICKLHIECISETSGHFFSKFGFEPQQPGSEDYYKVLDYHPPLPGPPEGNITVNFFDEEGWYGSNTPFKSRQIPYVFHDGEIWLSELCHDATVRHAGADRLIQVALDGRVLLEEWSGSAKFQAFGFSIGRDWRYNVARRFRLAG